MVTAAPKGNARKPLFPLERVKTRALGIDPARRNGMSFLRTVSVIVGGALVALGGSALALLM